MIFFHKIQSQYIIWNHLHLSICKDQELFILLCLHPSIVQHFLIQYRECQDANFYLGLHRISTNVVTNDICACFYLPFLNIRACSPSNIWKRITVYTKILWFRQPLWIHISQAHQPRNYLGAPQMFPTSTYRFPRELNP